MKVPNNSGCHPRRDSLERVRSVGDGGVAKQSDLHAWNKSAHGREFDVRRCVMEV